MDLVVAERLDFRCEVLDEDVQVAHRAERPAQPLQLVPHGLATTRDRVARCRPAGRPGAVASRRASGATPRIRSRASCPDRGRARARPVPECGRAASRRSTRRRARRPGSAWNSRSSAWNTFGRVSPSVAPARRSSFSIRRSVFSSPSINSTSSSSKLRVTRWWSRTATVSWTTSAPSATDALAAGPEPRDRQQRGATKVGDEQFQHVVRWRARPAVGLELEPSVAPQQLQLPEPLPVLDAVPQRDAATREPVVGRVVVGRDEETRLDRLATELGQLELACCPQLHLPLERLADRHHTESRHAAVKER